MYLELQAMARKRYILGEVLHRSLKDNLVS
jgi:hypothetical protein